MDTKQLYNDNATTWVRKKPRSLSDFTGRPPVFSLMGELAGKSVLDLGCGEGYCAREFKNRGANKVIAIDLSEEMINNAIKQEQLEPMGIEYHACNVLDYNHQKDFFDLVAAVFVFNYISIEEMGKVMKKAYELLKPGGSFVFSVPHPALAFIWKGKMPFYFETEAKGYFSAKDTKFQGEIGLIDGGSLKVQMMHKNFEDYFTHLKQAGFTKIPEIRELHVLDEHIKQNASFFGPIKDIPLHVAFKVQK